MASGCRRPAAGAGERWWSASEGRGWGWGLGERSEAAAAGQGVCGAGLRVGVNPTVAGVQSPAGPASGPVPVSLSRRAAVPVCPQHGVPVLAHCGVLASVR